MKKEKIEPLATNFSVFVDLLVSAQRDTTFSGLFSKKNRLPPIFNGHLAYQLNDPMVQINNHFYFKRDPTNHCNIFLIYYDRYCMKLMYENNKLQLEVCLNLVHG